MGRLVDAEVPSSSSETSLTLLEGLRCADENAWGRFIDIYGGLIYSWCVRYGAEPNDCGDLVQEVFLKVSKGINRFRRADKKSSFRGWLRTVTKHAVFDHLKKQGGQRPAVGGDDPMIDQAEAIAPDEDFAEVQIIIERAYAVMRTDFNTRWCEAFDLLLEGYTSREVAEKLGMTATAVRQANYKIRRRMREELREFEDLL